MPLRGENIAYRKAGIAKRSPIEPAPISLLSTSLKCGAAIGIQQNLQKATQQYSNKGFDYN